MNSVTKYLLLFIGALLGIVFLVVSVSSIITQDRLNTQYEIPVNPITIPEGESARARGEHLVRAVSSCVSCHGPDLGGKEFIDEPLLAQIYAPNLTSGKG